ncbi:MAG TPA: hypothetical protein PKE06_18270 [Flavilitoribacter sp.]|nr:hypothetical protein [Flavilitoribacter sp.]HMQ91471.1 hypothetical protein [Flavilitoribacter sp.]
MKKLSIWARRNPVPARWIIVFAQILTVLLGGLAGLAFYFRGIVLPKEIWLFSAGVLMAVFLIRMISRSGRAGKKVSW